MDGLVVAGGPGMPIPRRSSQAPGGGRGTGGHRAYLDGRMALEQFDAMDCCSSPCQWGSREFLLFQLLGELKSSGAPSPRCWPGVRAQAAKAPQWLVEGRWTVSLVQLPAYDFPPRPGWC